MKSNYFLAAYPFALPPEEAKLRMGIMAQRYCGEERFNGLFDHLKWAFLDIQPKLPVTFSAIYLPFWIIGARSYLRWTHMGGDEVFSPAFLSSQTAADTSFRFPKEK